jgi:hypothetical protein
MPLRHTIAEWGMWSVLIANYVNSGKRQEQVADKAAVVQC